jgi:hypothetical protein
MDKDRKDQPWVPITRPSVPYRNPAASEASPGAQDLRFEVLQHPRGGMPDEIRVTNGLGLSRVYVSQESANAARESIDIIFDGPPDQEATRLVDVQDEHGLPGGAWLEGDDGSWALRITPFDFSEEAVRQAEEATRERSENEEPEDDENDEPPEEERGP